MFGLKNWLFVLLAALILGCPAHTSKKRYSFDDEYNDEYESDDSEDRDEDDSSDEEDEEDDSEDEELKPEHEKLPDAVTSTSLDGNPMVKAKQLRMVLCGNRSSEPVIFYHLIVHKHWHYYWLCSETGARRLSSKVGARKVRRWLKGFQNQAKNLSASCPPSSAKAILKGEHESGIKAVAYCDGRIELIFPDGGKSVRRFSANGGQSFSGGQAPIPQGSTSSECPPCPPCQSASGQACPPVQPCPIPRPCAACPACPPKVDCGPIALEAGKKAFRQGVEKACKRICSLIYTKCRQINPNTALCHQVSEYCAVTCPK